MLYLNPVMSEKVKSSSQKDLLFTLADSNFIEMVHELNSK